MTYFHSANLILALHAADVANPHHTTLLLNCYTKSKDVQKLNDFIKVSYFFARAPQLTVQRPELNFDVETAIRVCLQANYDEIALALAKNHRAHHWYRGVCIPFI